MTPLLIVLLAAVVGTAAASACYPDRWPTAPVSVETASQVLIGGAIFCPNTSWIVSYSYTNTSGATIGTTGFNYGPPSNSMDGATLQVTCTENSAQFFNSTFTFTDNHGLTFSVIMPLRFFHFGIPPTQFSSVPAANTIQSFVAGSTVTYQLSLYNPAPEGGMDGANTFLVPFYVSATNIHGSAEHSGPDYWSQYLSQPTSSPGGYFPTNYTFSYPSDMVEYTTEYTFCLVQQTVYFSQSCTMTGAQPTIGSNGCICINFNVTPAPSPPPSSGGGGLTTAEYIGIGGGGLLLLAFVVGGVVYYRHKKAAEPLLDNSYLPQA